MFRGQIFYTLKFSSCYVITCSDTKKFCVVSRTMYIFYSPRCAVLTASLNKDTRLSRAKEQIYKPEDELVNLMRLL
jgi:hypothetical protein